MRTGAIKPQDHKAARKKVCCVHLQSTSKGHEQTFPGTAELSGKPTAVSCAFAKATWNWKSSDEGGRGRMRENTRFHTTGLASGEN